MFVEFDTLDGNHVMLKADVIWGITVILATDQPSEIIMAGGTQSIKISAAQALKLQERLRGV